jgi:hypothetical protein
MNRTLRELLENLFEDTNGAPDDPRCRTVTCRKAEINDLIRYYNRHYTKKQYKPFETPEE